MDELKTAIKALSDEAALQQAQAVLRGVLEGVERRLAKPTAAEPASTDADTDGAAQEVKAEPGDDEDGTLVGEAKGILFLEVDPASGW